MTIRECEKRLISILTKAGVDSPGLCSIMLLEYATCMTRLEVALYKDRLLSENEYRLLRSLAERACRHEPMAYIVGSKEFFEHRFVVSPATLIPRPETELLVELALSHVQNDRIVFLDAGCGSGNIGLSLLAQRKKWRGLLLDKYQAALKVARKNALNIAPQAMFSLGDIFDLPVSDNSLDLIISNPPYIGHGEEVMRDVLAFEPHLALFSEEGGFAHLKALAEEASRSLKYGGYLIVEHGAGQREKLLEIYRSYKFSSVTGYNDLAGRPRCLVVKK